MAVAGVPCRVWSLASAGGSMRRLAMAAMARELVQRRVQRTPTIETTEAAVSASSSGAPPNCAPSSAYCPGSHARQSLATASAAASGST
eukprot:scaffold179377_cov30-Tisochrysis_lutea.AAC.2